MKKSEVKRLFWFAVAYKSQTPLILVQGLRRNSTSETEMKMYLKYYAKLFALICSKILWLVYDYRLLKSVCTFRNRVFSYSNAKRFRKFGKNSRVAYSVVLVGTDCISIGNDTSVGDRTVLSAWSYYNNERYFPEILIGDNVHIGSDCHLTAIGRIVIGDGVLTGKKITITDNSHGLSTLDEMAIPPIKRKLYSKGEVVVGENVWIGDKATILPGVTIGYGAIVAANSVVTRDVPCKCVVAGNPAKIVKEMREEE